MGCHLVFCTAFLRFAREQYVHYSAKRGVVKLEKLQTELAHHSAVPETHHIAVPKHFNPCDPKSRVARVEALKTKDTGISPVSFFIVRPNHCGSHGAAPVHRTAAPDYT